MSFAKHIATSREMQCVYIAFDLSSNNNDMLLLIMRSKYHNDDKSGRMEDYESIIKIGTYGSSTCSIA